MSVGFLIVSHSEKIAEGICELAAQMASDVDLVPAGGTDDGGIGTSFEKIQAGIESADSGDGLLILTDLGSAVMTTESVLEFLDEDQQKRIRLLPGVPLVEGAIAAAVSAQTGAELDAVARAAETAIPPAPTPAPAATSGAEPSGEFELINPMGLHARPAAALAQALTPMDADIMINGVDAKSVMLLMTLGLKQGQTLSVHASGAEAQKAVDFVLAEAADGFGEL
ncbi:dihydroxyacetone kinase phosphoryl donor subunit DhaM [Arthrobacter monumenti]